MAFRKNDLFAPPKKKPRIEKEEVKSFSVEIDSKKENSEVVPKLTLALYDTKFFFREAWKEKKMEGVTVEFLSETDFLDKRRIVISITPNKDNITTVDSTFREILKDIHDKMLLDLRDKVEVVKQYENYLIKNNLLEKKANTDKAFNSYRPGGNTAY